jgi:hypothetical protein
MEEDIYSCFISYRHPASKDNREAKLIRHVVQAFSDHIEMYTHDHTVYFDEKRLVPGYQYDEKLAQAICRSACMVVIYWPAYLESDYCKKEMQTMLDIEARRREQLDLHGDRLFIPVIIHGRFEDLPEQLTTGTQYLDYTAQATRPNANLGNNHKMSQQLYKTAKYIKDLCDKMKKQRTDIFGECSKFSFAESTASRAANIRRAPTQRFPGR